jgi:hypothetical protein
MHLSSIRGVLQSHYKAVAYDFASQSFSKSSVDIRVLNVNNSGAYSAATVVEAPISSPFRERTLGHRFVVIQDNNE